MTPSHLQATVTERGFTHMPSIPGQYGGDIRVYESSAAEGPHIWLCATAPLDLDGQPSRATMHLTVEDALKLADQLHYLAEHHYQRRA
jgi:hypothetical protein